MKARFIKASTKAKFEEALGNDEIPEYSIVFIEREKLIWARGSYYPSEIVDNLTDGGSNSPLSAEQGKELKLLIDSNSSRISSIESELEGVNSSLDQLELYTI